MFKSNSRLGLLLLLGLYNYNHCYSYFKPYFIIKPVNIYVSLLYVYQWSYNFTVVSSIPRIGRASQWHFQPFSRAIWRWICRNNWLLHLSSYLYLLNLLFIIRDRKGLLMSQNNDKVVWCEPWRFKKTSPLELSGRLSVFCWSGIRLVRFRKCL